MGVTYTSAIDRDRLRQGYGGQDIRYTKDIARRLNDGHLLLALTSLVAMTAVALSFGGRLHSIGVIHSSTLPVINLNTLAASEELEPVLGLVFASPSDRRFAAQGLFEFIRSVREAGDSLPNVGAILGARASVSAAELPPGLVEYGERLREARQRAEKAGNPAPTILPLLTSSDLATLKPSLIVRTPETFARLTLLWGAVYLISFWGLALFWWFRAFRGDGVLLATAHFLTAIGFAALLSRPDPLRDTVLIVRYTQGVVFGLGLFGVVSLLDFRKAAFLRLSYVPLTVALLLSVVLILFGHGPGNSDVKVNLGPVQPIEAIRLLLALFLAGYFARRWELLRQIRAGSVRDYRVPDWLHLPRLDYVLPVLFGVAAALMFFFVQKDLGPALFISCVFLAMYAIARKRVGMAMTGLAILIGGFYVGYKLDVSTTLAARVQMWQLPWDNGIRGGDQIAQVFWALSTGGLFGTGLGLGDSRYLPAGHTDLALAAIGEELGFVGLLSIAAAYCVIAARGCRAGLKAANDYAFFLATAVTLFLMIPVLIMVAGMLGVVPLTGVATPFLSYGGSAMVANFAALGILTAIGTHAKGATTAEPFRAPVRYLGALLTVSALGLLAVLLNIQVLSADAYVVKPHLGIQADGVRRYQYNQRVLDVMRIIPRGTVYDRAGLPLATGDVAVVRHARDDYRKLGIALHESCAEPIERCYPLGGAAFHLLGDARTRLNWSAANASYVERDAETRLRGFDDHETLVQIHDRSGRAIPTVRRDYRELVPLLRHRYEPDHEEVRAFLDRTRDVTLTIDGRLQARVAAILSEHAVKSGRGRAAAVVIDPDTGDLLAISSYPFPDVESGDQNGEVAHDTDSLLDRARYGLYPPGSTFKLVTATAALRRNIALSRATFACTFLPNGRVGARIPGWGPVRDDVLDAHPHGTISMHDGIVRSCNAYSAQLAVHLGPQALLDTARRLGISLTPSNSVERLRATLPQAGYGQGDVLATPLRMSRLAAAIASGGMLREPRLEARSSEPTKSEILLPPDAAALLSRYLRDAVLNGTGRSLRDHRWRIAGKTGTAEVTGSQSHAWFVGFAPYGSAQKRIAFAIVIENAGYGGLAAAPVAGEIVTAAATFGLIR